MSARMRMIPLLALALMVAWLAAGLVSHSKNQTSGQSPLVGQTFPLSEFQDFRNGSVLPVASENSSVLVVNVFASWCETCALEMPQFTTLALSDAATLVGIAWKDDQARLNTWLARHDNPYQLIQFDSKGETTAALGLTGVPETFVIDKQGKIAAHYKMAITQQVLEEELLPLIQKLGAQHAQ